MNTEWRRIHDFFYGYGYINGDKRMFERDVKRLLKHSLFEEEVSLDEVYEKLQPLLIVDCEERKKNYRPFKLEKLSIPLVNREYPKL